MISSNDNAVINYSHLITTRPHDICRVVISDLHLSADEPALAQAFLALLNDLTALSNLCELYILGDWFDAWIGDDAYLSLSAVEKRAHWITPIIDKLIQLDQNGCKTLVMHGNRDFLIGQAFCDLFNGELISEPYYIKLGGLNFRLEHGDALCTDDIAYQRFRRLMRNPIVQWALLRKPLAKRVALARKIRQRSAQGKQNKSLEIMDVNELAVIKAVKKADHLLHGHTHRPARHTVPNISQHKFRYVLGDWRVINPDSSNQKVDAIIGITTKDMTPMDISLGYTQENIDIKEDRNNNYSNNKNPDDIDPNDIKKYVNSYMNNCFNNYDNNNETFQLAKFSY